MPAGSAQRRSARDDSVFVTLYSAELVSERERKFMNIKMILASAGLAAAASAASAQEATPVPVILTPSGGSLVAEFTRSATGLFVDTFSFTPTSVSGTVSVTLTPVNGSVSFFAALLNDDGFSFMPELGQASAFNPPSTPARLSR